jgi:phosphatidylglycerophosphate synthase
MQLLDTLRDAVRSVMDRIARWLHALSGGRITPNSVTVTGLIAHLFIAWLIAQEYFGYGALLLVVFGLFDALDGALARLQNKAGNAGMLLDASTDRMKEVILYTGAAFALVAMDEAYWAVWAVAACGASICVSYVKAKGETAVAGGKLTANQVNRLFQDGLGRFEVRMFLLIVGLLLNELGIVLVIITALSTYTAFERLIKITRKLQNV